MPSFFLAEIEVLDPEMYRAYIEKARPIVIRHGGQYILRSNDITPVSGDWAPQRLILVRFDSRADIEKCFGSEAYRRIKHLREQSTNSRIVIIDQDADISQAPTGA